MADKMFEARMQGMIFIANIANSKGIDEMNKELKKRGVYKTPLVYTDAQVNEFIQYICDNTRNTTFALTFHVLNEVFGFGEQRLNKFAEEFNKRFNQCLDLDYMGEHYVKLEDFAIDIKNKYKNLILDIQRIAICQDEHDKGNPDYKNYEYINGVINTLRFAGYHDAADYLETKKVNE